MKCCDWNPQNHTSWHCTECCATFIEYRDRDKHFALTHASEVHEYNERYYHYNYTRRGNHG